MKCNDCRNFKQNKELEVSGEFMDNYGTCGISGSVCKINDDCKNGSYERDEY